MLAFPKPSPTRDRIDQKRDQDKKLRDAIVAVWARDGSTCRACGRRVRRSNSGVALRGHVHHVVKRSQSKSLRSNPDNLLLLCSTCHADVHTYDLVIFGTVGHFTFSKARRQ
jgi:5-methylcytosine-specific restriction endonuclease McrA